MPRNSKYSISDKFGERHAAINPRTAALSRPKWAGRFRYFTHETPGGNIFSPTLYSLTEVTTGLAVVRDCRSRNDAIRAAEKRLAEAGFRATAKALRERKVKP